MANTFTPPTSGTTTPPALPNDVVRSWRALGSENSTVQVPEGTVLRYGVGSTFYYVTMTSSDPFVVTNTIFGGDPVANTAKHVEGYLPVVTITPTVSTPGFRVVTVGIGKDYPTLKDFLIYANGVDITANGEILCAEVYENQYLKSDWFEFGAYNAGTVNNYIIIRPVPGLDVASLEANSPLTYGTSGVELSMPTGSNTQMKPGVLIDGMRIRFTYSGNDYALRWKYNGGKRLSLQRCRVLVDTGAQTPMVIGESYGEGDIRDCLIVFTPTCSAKLFDAYGPPPSTIERNTFVRLGASGPFTGDIHNYNNLSNNAFVNMGTKVATNLVYNAFCVGNVSNYAGDARDGFTIADVTTMVIDPVKDLRPIPGGALVGAATVSAANTLDIYGVSRGSVPNTGASQVLGVAPDPSQFTLSGAMDNGNFVATIGYTYTMRIGVNSVFKDGQELSLTFQGTNFTASPTNPRLNKSKPYVDVDFIFTGAIGQHSIKIVPTGTPVFSNLDFSVNVIAPVPADKLIIEAPTKGTGGTTSAVKISVNRPLTDGQTVVVSLSDNANGVFSPSSFTLTASTQTQTVSYTPNKFAGGTFTITATTTGGTLSLSTATASILLTPAPPDYGPGENIYHVGVNQQLTSWDALASFLEGKNNVTTKAKVIVYIHDDMTITKAFNAGATIDYPITIKPAPGMGFVDLDAGPARWIPSVGRTLTITNQFMTIPYGVIIEGFRLLFNGGALKYASSYNSRGDGMGFYRNIIEISNGATSPSIISGEYATDCTMVANLIIKRGGSGPAIDMRDSNGSMLNNTFVTLGGWTGNTIVTYGSYGAGTNVQGNVAYNCGANPISVGSGLNNAGFTRNLTNVPLDGTASKGFTVVSSSMFQNPASDLRPAANGPLIGTGSAVVKNTNDLYLKNYGYAPDAGAIQLNPAIPLPVATITSVIVDGQTITISGTTTNTPTTGVITIMPDTTVANNTANQVGPFAISLTPGAFSFTMDAISPGSYNAPNIILENAGGHSQPASGAPTILILGVDGQPQSPDSVNSGSVQLVITSVSVKGAVLSATGLVTFNSDGNGTMEVYVDSLTTGVTTGPFIPTIVDKVWSVSAPAPFGKSKMRFVASAHADISTVISTDITVVRAFGKPLLPL